MMVGATTDNGATFVAKVDGGGPVRVAVADNGDMTNPVFTSSQVVDAQGVAKVSITGLDPATRYWWQTEDNSVIDISVTGRFQTHPTLGQPASFTIAAASCAGLGSAFPGSGSELASDRLSDHPVFDTVRQTDPLMFVHLGDIHYYDLGSDLHGIVGGGSLANYRASYDDVLAQSRQAQLYREIPLAYTWDDHDFGPNDSDGTLIDKGNAATVYRERVPHYSLSDSDAIYQSWQIGRVLFIASDIRYYRDPNGDPQGPSKTMLGAAQKAWLGGLLSSSSAEALVWFMGSQWLHPSGSDTWASFTDERQELADLFVEYGWADRMVMVYGDRHALGIDSGAGNDWGGFPVLMAASLDASPSVGDVAGAFDVLPNVGGRDQYGTIAVTDDGTIIKIALSAWRGTTLMGEYLFVTGGVPSPPIFVPGSVAALLTGSHTVHYEARLLTEFQTGIDPTGTDLDLINGDVQLNGTASVRGTADLQVPGVKYQEGPSAFPRGKDTLLNPLTGNEIFVRYGIELSADEPFWTPLGYYRITDVDQDGSSDSPIKLMCHDRMATIVESELLEPRVYVANTTVAAVFDDLVLEIYPDAVIVFDDGSGFATLGRQLVIEKNRYAGLYELATSLGKIMYWDREGILRIVSLPDEDEIVWEVKAGPAGVLVGANRSVSRDGTFNAWVVTGEGGDAQNPARGVAVDANPTSLTFFENSRFGKIPFFFSTPAVTTGVQAAAAARSGLARTLGAAYSIDFAAIVNPALEPWQAVRVTYKDGNRDIHVIESLTIPLNMGTAMSAITRGSSVIVIQGGV